MNNSYKLGLAAIAASVALVGCGGGGGDTAGAAAKEVTGQFIDAAVVGLNYTCAPSNKTGLTDAEGYYTCNTGDTVTFSLGAYELGTTDASSGIVTPYDLQSDNETAVNVAQLLQTLDTNTSDDIITIPENFTALDNSDVELNATDFDTAIVTDLNNTEITALVGEGQAQNSMDADILNALIEGKTYYTIGGDNDMSLLRLEFNEGVMAITDVTPGVTSVPLDGDTYEIINDRLTTGSGEYATLVEHTADYIVVEKFTSGNVSLGEKTFYVDQADAEHAYWTLYGITQEKLDGKTLYHVEEEFDNGDQSPKTGDLYSSMTLANGTLTRTEFWVNATNPEDTAYDSFTVSYEIIDGKVRIDVPAMDGEPAMYIWWTLESESAESWVIIDEEDQNKDGSIEYTQTDTYYLSKPADYPDFTVSTTPIDTVGTGSTTSVYQITDAELSNQTVTVSVDATRDATLMFNSNATGWDSLDGAFTWSINGNYELIVSYSNGTTMRITFSASPASGSTITADGTDYTVTSYSTADWGSFLTGRSHVFIYKNISAVTADQLKATWENSQDFYALDLGAASAGNMSCADLGFTTANSTYSTVTVDTGYGTVTSSSYTIVNMTDYTSSSCTEVDYAGLQYVGGTTDLALTYNIY